MAEDKWHDSYTGRDTFDWIIFQVDPEFVKSALSHVLGSLRIQNSGALLCSRFVIEESRSLGLVWELCLEWLLI